MNLVILAICAAPAFVNLSKLAITKHDQEVFERLKITHQCAQKYKDAPCMKRMLKLGFQRYHVECGGLDGRD